jgi:ABC-type sugar transport system permease subunit
MMRVQVQSSEQNHTALRKRLETLWFSQTVRAYVYMAPFLVLFVVFLIYPLFSTVDLSLRKATIMTTNTAPFNDLGNYTRILQDTRFAKALWNTLLYTVLYTIPAVAFGLGLAVLLNQKIRFQGFFRTAFFAPVVTSTVAVAIVWEFLYQPRFGLFNQILGALGLPQSGWLTRPETAMLSIAIMSVWKSVGYNMVLYLAGLQSIPASFYEAANIDGASKWQSFRLITLPLLQRTTVFTVTLTVIGSFQVFTQIWVMTKGGPLDSTRPIVQYIYDVAFGSQGNLGYASAMGVVLLLLVLIVTAIQLWLGRTKWDY